MPIRPKKIDHLLSVNESKIECVRLDFFFINLGLLEIEMRAFFIFMYRGGKPTFPSSLGAGMF